MAGIAEIALGVTTSLVASCIQSATSISTLSFFDKRKIQSRIDDATAEVVEPLVLFLAQEGIDERKQQLLFEVTIRELQPLSADSSALFSGSLDGQRIFDNLYDKRPLPQEIVDEGLVDTYSLLCPRVCALICQIPVAVKDWESNAWAENYKKLDTISLELRQLFEALDDPGKSITDSSDATLSMAQKSLTQQVSMSLDLTGLRADKPLEGKLDDFFVYPEIRETGKKDKLQILNTPKRALDKLVFEQTYAVIIGQPGSGKSTWSRWFQREVLRGEWSGLAIRFELRQLDLDNLPSVHQLVRKSLSVHLTEDITAQRVREWVSSERLLFILDGFDEVPPRSREKVISWTKELSISLEKCSVLLTSREITTDHLSNLPISWSNWNIEAFDDPRIEEYVERWHANVPLKEGLAAKVSTDQIIRELNGDPTIKPLTSNPLLLSTLLMVHHLDGKLPDGRSELYKRYVEGMLGLWDARRKVAPIESDLSTRDKQNILTDLAIHFHFLEKEQADELDVIRIVRKSLAKLGRNLDVEEVMSLLRERSGLLVGPGTYSFIHKSVGEYLVASAVVQGTDLDPDGRRLDNFNLFANRNEDRWRVILFIWAGLSPLADLLSFIKQVIEKGDLNLAYGIVFDQYERFSFEIKCELVHGLTRFNSQLNKSEGPYMTWISGGPVDRSLWSNFEIPDIEITGLRFAELNNLLERLIDDKVLTISDFKRSKGKYRELLWMLLANETNETAVFKYCCTKIPAKLVTKEAWIYWLGRTVAWRATSSKTKDHIDDFYRIFIQAFPSHSGVVKLEALTIINYYQNHDHWDLSECTVEKILYLISDTTANKIPPDVLIHTKKWSSSGAENEGYDLLFGSLSHLDQLFEDSLIDEPQLVEATRFVECILKQRQPFEVSSLN